MPVLAALAAVAAREPWLQVCAGEPAGQGWHRGADLLTGAALEELVRTGAERLHGEHPTAGQRVLRTVAAAVLLDHWAWAVAVAGAGALAATGDVVDLAPERMHLRLEAGQITGIALQQLSRAHGEAGLRAELQGHLAPLHALLTSGPTPLLRRSRRLLEGGIGDAVARALVQQAQDLGSTERARLLALADRLLAEAATWGRPDWLVVDDVGPQELRTRRRTSCCLWYRLPEQPPCLSCPRRTAADRGELLREQALLPAEADA